ncbi:MAG: BamA/TamA family outer membrane protein [candidate division WS1 bacterium]|jgi:outer membrane protein insertion porin family|nr:BamA/TamA family outer membrane protein [candidate division WS1 bacterium]
MNDSRTRIALLAAIVPVLCAMASSHVVWAQEEPLIAALRVEGNDYISAEAIIAEVSDVLKIGAPFTARAREEAQRKLMRMGYFDTVAVDAQDADTGVAVVITVVEKKRITRVELVGNTVITDAELRESMFIREGHVIDDAAIRRDVGRIADYYSQKGYLAEVTDVQVSQFGVVTFVITEARIEEVLIEGLIRTKDEVVSRELELQAGELFQEQKIVEQIRRIYNLGMFENVSSDIRPGVKDPERGVIVALQVEEKRTGQFSVAAGYSNLDKFVLVLSLAENNFRGKGERASVDVELFGRTSYETKYFKPYVDSKGSSFSIRLFDTERSRRFVGGAAVTTSEDVFDERRTGVNMSLSRPTGSQSRMTFGFRSEKVSSSFLQGTRLIGEGSIPGVGGNLPGDHRTGDGLSGDGASGGNYDPGSISDTPGPGDMLGPILVAAPLHPGGRLASITLGRTMDSRDLLANPTSGGYTDISLELAHKLVGGEVQFQKLTAERRMYRTLGSPKQILAARLMLGAAFGDLPLFESFSVGGSNTLRGYREDRFRGEKMALLNVEYRRAISDKLWAVGFVDVGSSFDGKFPTVIPGFSIPAEDSSLDPHVGAGVGLRVETPIGPIRLDFGYGEDGSQAHFSFGHMF